MPYHVVNLRNNRPWIDLIASYNAYEFVPRVFQNGAEAAEAAKRLNFFAQYNREYQERSHDDGGGYLLSVIHPHSASIEKFDDLILCQATDKWQVRPIIVRNEEQLAEQEMNFYEDGTHKKVPWQDDPKWIEFITKSYQYPIVSTNGTCIEYFKTLQDALANSRTSLNYRTYLSKFFPVEAREWAALWKKHILDIEYKVASDSKEIRMIYENGPDSCMKGPPSKFFGTKAKRDTPHPVEIYGGESDIVLAYIEKNRKFTARCLIYPAKKTFVRFYGDDSALLKELLEADGYVEGTFDGAKVNSIRLDTLINLPFTYLKTYLDGSARFKYDPKTGDIRITKDSCSNGWQNGCFYFNGGTESNTTIYDMPYVCAKTEKSYNTGAIIVYKSSLDDYEIWWAGTPGWTKCYYSGKIFDSSINKFIDVLSSESDLPVKVHEQYVDKIPYCARLKMPALDTYNVVVGYDSNERSIIERWSRNAIKKDAFRYDGLNFANWLESNASKNESFFAYGKFPFSYEHLYVNGGRHTFTCVINEQNYTECLRVLKKDAFGYTMVDQNKVDDDEETTTPIERKGYYIPSSTDIRPYYYYSTSAGPTYNTGLTYADIESQTQNPRVYYYTVNTTITRG
jgi:hypothetical protein